jgi:CMP-N,N'-diacetyllegionaminic acid synthase
MKILALVPARGGSKRLPGKNLKILGGIPLINWSINVAYGISEICDVLVSTDDPKIADVSTKAGALVPWLRPRELSTDESSSVDVAIHALDWYESTQGFVDGILLLQPTSPFRNAVTVENGLSLFEKSNFKPVIGVTPSHPHPMWTLKLQDGYLVPFIKTSELKTGNQELPTTFTINGTFYLTSPSDLRKTKSFLGGQAVPLILPSSKETLDIDTEWDFNLARIILEHMKD